MANKHPRILTMTGENRREEGRSQRTAKSTAAASSAIGKRRAETILDIKHVIVFWCRCRDIRTQTIAQADGI